MTEIRITLIGDGSSDKALLYIIKWLSDDLYPQIANSISFADFRNLPEPPSKSDVKAQVDAAKEYYPFDILIYHRDAEDNNFKTIAKREVEVLDGLDSQYKKDIVCAIPIKMTESWLLIDEEAIKKAAGNRNYRGKISLPKINKIETINQPKKTLHDAIVSASGLKGRKLSRFNVHKAIHLLAEYITDYSPLRELEAFKKFEADFKKVINELYESKT